MKISFDVISKCPYCAASDIKKTDYDWVVRDELLSIYNCKCGYSFLNPRPSRDSIGSFYEDYGLHRLYDDVDSVSYKIKNYLLERGGGYRGSHDILMTFLAPNLIQWLVPDKSGSKDLLDVGAGGGKVMLYYKKHGWDVKGTEFSPKAVENAKKCGLDMRMGDIKDAGYAPESFDVILLNHVLEHMYDPFDALKVCFTLLKPGGKLFLNVPNISSIERVIFGTEWNSWSIPVHFSHFSRGFLRGVLKETGYEITQERCCNHYADLISYNKKLFQGRKLSWIPKCAFYDLVFFATMFSRKYSSMMGFVAMKPLK
jgi:2-polyprenyl-3-methyl-5-hydroxy-6-metoxy-1,4-benzoquinol methylase